jgi:sortase A
MLRHLSLVTADYVETPSADESESPVDPVVEPDAAQESAEPQPVPRSGAPAPKIPVIFLAMLIALCAAVVFSYLFATVFSGLQEQRDQHQLYSQFRGLLDPSSPVAPKIGGEISAGFPVALMSSPQAQIHKLVVIEGTSSSDLLAGPGHLPDTPLPGQRGNSVVMGKSTTAGAPFRDLGDLRRGDTIDVVTGEGNFRYTVVDIRKGGTKPPRLKSRSVLTLVTGNSAWSLGSGSSSASLVYVDATRSATPAGTPAGQPRAVPSSEDPGSNEPDAFPLVLLWVAVLLAASATCWWLWARWGLVRTWLIGAPVLFAVLWMLSSQVMRLLPNIY